MAVPEQDEEGRGLARVLAFSDGVFAIAITLLVLNFHVPSLPARDLDHRLLKALLHDGGLFIGFVISFYVIARYWMAHHRLSLLLRRVDTRFIVLNLALLGSIAFLPFPTEIVGLYGQTTTAVVFYALAIMVTGVLSAAVWQYALSRDLVDGAVTARGRRETLVRSVVPPVVFATSIPIAFVSPSIAKYWWALLFAQAWVLRWIDARQPASGGDHASR